mgnify:CR=1 FL=1
MEGECVRAERNRLEQEEIGTHDLAEHLSRRLPRGGVALIDGVDADAVELGDHCKQAAEGRGQLMEGPGRSKSGRLAGVDCAHGYDKVRTARLEGGQR